MNGIHRSSVFLRNLAGPFIVVILCLTVFTGFIPIVHAEQVPAGIEPVIVPANLSPADPPPVITGGGKGYYLVHSNAEGADVYFNGDWYVGKIANGTLLVQTCLTCTPVWTFTVKECGYFARTQNNTRYPHQDEVIDLYANLSQPGEPLIPDFTANVTEASAPPLTVGFTSFSVGVPETWNWNFGDGDTSPDINPVHTYRNPGVYTVSLQEANSACQNETTVKNDYITVNNIPKPTFLADFTVTPTSGQPPLTVKCTDTSIGSPTRYNYDFGDGVSVSGPNPMHTYRYPGSYSITLTITKYNRTSNSVMMTSTIKSNIITVGTVPFVTPVAQFTASPIRGPAPLTVAFTDRSSGNPTYYNYDFGDGVNTTGPNAVHTYHNNGTYTVTLTVMKNNPATGSMVGNSSVRKNLIIVGPNSPPLPQTVCDQPYGLCTVAKCEPMESDPTKAICSCLIEDGVSLGTSTCNERQPTDLYYSVKDGWMIPAGAAVGHLTSTYSFINSVPRDENKIPNRFIDPNYTGSLILKPCNAPLWANCLDMKCYVPPADPGADINKDRKAANYTICECSMVTDTPDFYMAASEGEASCADTGICHQYIWSAAFIETMDQGIGVLKSYLAVHPTQDLAQQYTMPICEPCGAGK
jgi:PKD repeat protein